MKPAYTEHVTFGPSHSSRHGARVRYFLLHTQEGNGTAQSLAQYLNNPANGASYHYTLRDSIVYSIVDTDRSAWSALDANPYSINLCFAGSRAGWSRAEWMQRKADIEIAAWLAVEDAKKYGFTPQVNGRPYPLGRADSIADHNFVTQVLKIGTHWDVGPNFPWDVLDAAVKRYTTGQPAPKPVPNLIDGEAVVAGGWLGKRLHTGERDAIDGGKYADFAAGSIYWHPRTGAIAVPKHIYETWQTHDWERGFLGYPTVRHTVLPVDSPDKIGDVQAFEGGVIYRQYGQPGYVVHGVIGARWAREGYEIGPLGWPVSDEYDTDDGGKAQDFENGRMLWHESGAISILTDGKA